MDLRAVGHTLVGKYYPTLQLSGTAASNGDNTLVSAPAAGHHLVVTDIIVQNESDTDVTAILKSGSTACWRQLLLTATKTKLEYHFPLGQEWRLDSASALVLNLSAAKSHGYSLRYFTERD